MDDGIPRPSCRNTLTKGKSSSNRCLKIDEGCPQIVIASSKNVSVQSSSCNGQAGYICNLGKLLGENVDFKFTIYICLPINMCEKVLPGQDFILK